jgi:non-ribosomal peptide synthetase component E (peptide arylation enzyme)
MDPIEKRELKRKAWMRLAAQRRRAGLLRGRVVVLSLLCFAILWGAVFAQMITGNDPVLAAKKSTAATRTVASAKEALGPADPRKRKSHREVAAEAGEAEALQAEAEEAEVLQIEAEEIEAAEFEEPLVTSQS